MTDKPEITLAFIARQLDRVLDRFGAVEDKLEIMSGQSVRHNGTALEVMGMRRLVDRLDKRVQRLEERAPDL
jgi:hypothetical protein